MAKKKNCATCGGKILPNTAVQMYDEKQAKVVDVHDNHLYRKPFLKIPLKGA
ncbi:hypothetical protein KL86SPO_50148 [uncultured Sporomusa sp.]|uniref:Uncharacterized protein n=1 Tax=uncultured Sporomusa sp. TaxID=307249 RepID=A0A212LY60_9FIRM|nr:hypothetical protein [uncultured Sporomusa sp.]SCM82377.1 hypothetical protein KL86SPO_50148 [uncultured Sporomusa sp.]